MTAEPLAVLRRIRETPIPTRPRPGEWCELCRNPISEDHSHLVDVELRPSSTGSYRRKWV